MPISPPPQVPVSVWVTFKAVLEKVSSYELNPKTLESKKWKNQYKKKDKQAMQVAGYIPDIGKEPFETINNKAIPDATKMFIYRKMVSSKQSYDFTEAGTTATRLIKHYRHIKCVAFILSNGESVVLNKWQKEKFPATYIKTLFRFEGVPDPDINLVDKARTMTRKDSKKGGRKFTVADAIQSIMSKFPEGYIYTIKKRCEFPLPLLLAFMMVLCQWK